MLDQTSILALPLFSGLRPEDAVDLVRCCQAVALSDGTVLFEEGEDADDLYILVEGVLVIRCVGATGESVEVGRACPGDLVGEMGVIDKAPRSASAIASGAVRLLSLDGQAFRRLIDGAHPAAWTLLRQIRRLLVRRLRAQEQRASTTLLPVSPGVDCSPRAAPDDADGFVERVWALWGALRGSGP